jgi:2-dehydro-3-deoxygalactonokinase
MSGMIGSRQGWFEVPYRRCPVTIESIALGSHCVSSTDMPIRIVPGIEGIGISGAPDVMRGEETQISGALSIANIEEGILCIPGTHSKWVNIEDRTITGFSTFITGETYAVLKDHSILGKLFTAPCDDPAAFLEGVKRADSPGGLLHQLFGVRSEGIANNIKAGKLASFMSGLLIGSEIIEACRTFKGQTPNIYLLATNEMADLYQRALQANQFTATLIDPEKAAAKGLWASARVTGLI